MESDKNTQPNSLEESILVKIREMDLGASHNIKHLTNVLHFAQNLQAIYGGDVEVITAAALLHDLGRINKSLTGGRSNESRDLSVYLADPILHDIDFPEDRIPDVLRCILEHDQPNTSPTTIESTILREADFLDGFGANGILRSAIWTGEIGGDTEDLFNRLERKMPERIKSLVFPESRTYAMKEYLFVRLFLQKVRNREFDLPQQKGKYIVIEGISGAGKGTQTNLLVSYLKNNKAKVLRIKEPTANYPQIKEAFRNRRDQISRMLIFLADRFVNLQKDIDNHMKDGGIVVSDRSFISTLVYQSRDGGLSSEEIAYYHQIVTQPSLVIILDIDPLTSYKRLQQRYQTGAAVGENEDFEKLRRDREAFLSLRYMFPNIEVIDADGKSIEEISSEIRSLMVKHKIY